MQAKYFPLTTILHANYKTDCSWAWKGLQKKLPFIKANSRWRVGSGTKIKIWLDVWILGMTEPPTPRQDAVHSENYIWVLELIIQEDNQWNSILVQQLFDPETASLILQMRLPTTTEDKLICNPTRNGIFSLKSRYINSSCPFCNQHMEETMHVLFTCPFSRAVWMIIPGGSGILAGVHSNIATVFESWMNAVRQKSRSESWLKLAMTVSWSIWNEKCEVQFQKKKANPVEVARKAMSFASYLDGLYKKQRDRVVARLPKTNTLHWKPHVSPFYVINCDASYDKNTKLTGIALVLRDFAGNWWGCSIKCYAGVKVSEHAECLAFSEAVKWSKALQHTHVVLETDLQ
ncbi:uncharacterized protein LOC113351652 [Papaver somniferum]|uniref:uncharacterized protein LOC113351652 n=1 Tax=Papaver somniferum TaxID=3469 RepID=UPI000E6F62BA|nr:uncharacterized protein LOC113351652 [Papaver somniferum]